MPAKRRKRRVGAYQLAAAAAGKRPRRVEDITRNGYTLTHWRRTDRFPRRWAYTLGRRGDGAILVRDERTFSTLLKAFALTLDEADEILRLYDRVRPAFRRVLRTKDDLLSMDNPLKGWHEPKLVGGSLVFFATSHSRGAVKRITVAPDMGVQTTEVRSGQRLMLR